MAFDPPLPIDEALPAISSALAHGGGAVLVAPPGAGKTTRVPLALLDAPWRGDARILVLEPRRIAARAAAARMAKTLDEPVGRRVGLRVRFGSSVSDATRIEVVTEGVFTRMILDDPELAGVAAVLFDEFHERSLDADLALALALDVQGALRPDLRLLVMSATLDGARVARLLGAVPVIESAGRSYPVETRHLPRDPLARIEDAATAAVRRALAEERGSVLVFLPGQGEIRRTRERLEGAVAPEVDVAELHGGLEPADQDRAIAPSPAGRRKVVLATAIAETSLTIEGVRVVIDCGLARVPVFEPAVGLTRLATVRVSRAAADQRRGRAGRTEAGVCYRLWEQAATASLEPFARPEILSSDLAGLALDLAAWGVADPASLAFLDPPPQAAMAEARKLLADLGALGADGLITARGRALRALPLPPRLAAMVVGAAPLGHAARAAGLAAVLTERGLGGADIDLAHRLDAFTRDRDPRARAARASVGRWASEAGRAAGSMASRDLSAGAILSLAYPDRIAQPRGAMGAFRLANGRGGMVDPAHPLARAPFIVVADLAGSASGARILGAAEIGAAEIEALYSERIEQREELDFDAAALRLRARGRRRLGALLLEDRPIAVPAGPQAAAILARGIADAGIGRLPWTKAQLQLRERVGFLARAGGAWPDLSDAPLAATAEGWLAPWIEGRSGVADITAGDLDAALDALLPWSLRRRLEAEAPTHFQAPTGSRIAIDYSGEAPSVALRVQELFGLDGHPAIAGGRLPLVLELLSPAHRPIQVTRDLPGFWRGSWSAVRADMRGRYPKHPWPEDPLSEAPTTRAKPRQR